MATTKWTKAALSAHGIEPVELHVQKAALENVLLELTGTPSGNPTP